jgi:dolichol-phosphate mannosyltransferase
MAADGQDPPEILPELVARFTPQIDIVWARRESRVHDPWLRRTFSSFYYWLFRRLTGLDYPPGGFDFVAFTQRVAASLLSFRERNTSLFLLLFNLGYAQASVDYQRAPRQAGESSWTLRKRAKLAIDMVTAFSAAPIRLISALGVIVGFGGLVYGAITIVRALIGNVPIEGWASLMVVASLMGGLTLVALGFLGEYVWRTLEEARQRPLYIESKVFTTSSSDR